MHGGELNVKEVQKGGDIMYINVFTLKALIVTLFSWLAQINYWSLESYSGFRILLNFFPENINRKRRGQDRRKGEMNQRTSAIV